MDHEARARQEFGRQAAAMPAAPALAGRESLARVVEALGPAGSGRLLDPACGPDIVTAALAPDARPRPGA